MPGGVANFLCQINGQMPDLRNFERAILIPAGDGFWFLPGKGEIGEVLIPVGFSWFFPGFGQYQEAVW